MKADSFTLSEVWSDGGKIHYVLPHFQREYRWELKNWKTLLEDALDIYAVLPSNPKAKKPEHFLGALVIMPDGTIGLNIPVYRLVDGQQRLTTLSLLICAFVHVLGDKEPELRTELESLLFNTNQKGDGRFKLLPTLRNEDRAAYIAVLDGKPLPPNTSRIPLAFDYFSAELRKRMAGGEIEAAKFYSVLTQCMQVVCIRLNADENAYQIFESLNNKAEPLKQSDLVRNHIAMRLSSDKQEQVFLEHWAPIERVLDDDRMVGRSNLGELTAFLRHYDAMNVGTLPPEKHVYARFRDAMKRATTEEELIEEIATLRRFASYYNEFLRPDKGVIPALRQSLRRLHALDVSVAYPFMLAVSDALERGIISLEETVQGYEILENYLMRRFLVADQTSYLNKMFAALAGSIRWSEFLPSLKEALLARNYPTDLRIRQTLPSRQLYDKAGPREKTVLLFERINAHLYAGTDVKTVLDGEPTLEHILPQTLSAWWQRELGEEAEEIARDWKHTLGNLTLVTQSYNSSLSNDSFPEKQEKLLLHGLRLNSDYFSRIIELWSAKAIDDRAKWLTERILEIWPSFDLRGGSPTDAQRKPLAPAMPPPAALVIRGERLPTRTIRDVMRQAAGYVVTLGVNFVYLSSQMPNLIKQTPFATSSYDWDNGWYLNIHWDSQRTLDYTAMLLRCAGVADDEWYLEKREK